jgi:hypothetical protein
MFETKTRIYWATPWPTTVLTLLIGYEMNWWKPERAEISRGKVSLSHYNHIPRKSHWVAPGRLQHPLSAIALRFELVTSRNEARFQLGVCSNSRNSSNVFWMSRTPPLKPQSCLLLSITSKQYSHLSSIVQVKYKYSNIVLTVMSQLQYATFQEKTKSSSLSKSSLDKAIVK